jgi:prenyltransferase beta subunit
VSVRPEPLAVGGRANEETVLGGGPDLGCTYAAVCTASWIDPGWKLPALEGTIDYLLGLHRADGGYAPVPAGPGAPSELWATYMAGATLWTLGVDVPQPAATLSWLSRLREDGGFGMVPDQDADPWATYFGCRVATEICGITVPRDALARWLERLQAPGGGLAWSADAAAAGRARLGAAYAATGAWRSAAPGAEYVPWQPGPLVRWLQDQQRADGGFMLDPETPRSCLTATHHALAALGALGAAPRDPHACLRWILARRGPRGSFTRWEGYDVEDVWAAHHGIAALRLLGYPTDAFHEPVLSRLAEAACPEGGFTYRDAAMAAEALGAALTVMLGEGPGGRTRDWLGDLQVPEGGLARIPGGQAELRATLWATCAGAVGDSRRRVRAIRWLIGLQNADGGFGAWTGCASDLTSTVNALELDGRLGYEGARVDRTAAAAFLQRHWSAPGTEAHQDREPPLRSVLQSARGLALCGAPAGTVLPAVRGALARHASPSGGYSDRPGGVPDLLTSYEVVLTASRLGVPVDAPGLIYALESLRRPDGYAWTHSATAGGPLAYGFGSMLEEALLEDLRWPVPPLNLSR